MNDGHEPDAFEKRLRFGCGFVFGGAVIFLLALREVAAMSGGFWALVLGGAILAGYFAVRYGDDFWRSISRWF